MTRAGCRLVLGAVIVTLGLWGCSKRTTSSATVGSAIATVRVIRPTVEVRQGGQTALAEWQTRLAPGARVMARSGRAWILHDHGLRALVPGQTEVLVRANGLSLIGGVAWIEAPPGELSRVRVGDARIQASGAGFEVRLPPGGRPLVYVARGHVEILHRNRRVEVVAGDRAVIGPKGVSVKPEGLWEDWTGGLAWPAPDVPASPAGMGQIGARVPGSWGRASFPLATRNLKVQATVSKDLVTTIVDQVFFNPASDDLEGVYRVRVPRGAILRSFCIDRGGGTQLVCGFVKEKKAARTAYSKQVYVGSRDDPALLEWEAPGRYKAHIYPIRAGSTRRVVITYSEWLQWDGDVRRWRYPMASDSGVAPMIQELELKVNLHQSGATRIDSTLGAKVERNQVLLRRSDFRPRADFVVALRGGKKAKEARGFLAKNKSKDGRYLMVRVRPRELLLTGKRRGVDLVVVVDLSADTDPSELQLGRTMVEALLRHLGQGDRVAVLGADLNVFSAGGGKPALAPVTGPLIDKILDGLARRGVGGATDLGQVLTRAADLLQPGRGGAVVYIGDGVPTVGELNARGLRLRLSRQAVPARMYGVAVGSESNLGLLDALARHHGGLAMRVTDRISAALAALKVSAHASRPVMSKVRVDLGPGVERVFPTDPVSVVAGRDLVVLGRLRGKVPEVLRITGWYQGREIKGTEGTYRIRTVEIEDRGKLRRRWGSARLAQLVAGGAGREEVAELGTRFGLITEHTSIYVPSARELTTDGNLRNKVRTEQMAFALTVKDAERGEAERREEAKQGARSNQEIGAKATSTAAAAPAPASDKSEVLLNDPASSASSASRDQDKDAPAKESKKKRYRSRSVMSANKMDDRAKAIGGGPAGSTTTPTARRLRARKATGRFGEKTVSKGSGSLSALLGVDTGTTRSRQLGGGQGGKRREGLRGLGKGGGGGGGGGKDGDGFGLGGRGFGSGKYKSRAPRVFMSRASVSGGLDAATIRRVIRRHLSEIKYCYLSIGLPTNPKLQGMVKVSFTIAGGGNVGRVSIAQTTLNHRRTEGCIKKSVRRWRFPKPKGSMPFVTYPFHFKPGAVSKPSPPYASRHRIDVHITMQGKTHKPKRCSAAAGQPLANRAILWRERLQRKAGIHGAVEVWLDARRHCEARRWRDRRTLLRLILNRLGSVPQMTRFTLRYGKYVGWGARAYLRRMIYARIRTAKDLRVANNAFYPGRDLTRAQIVKLLTRLRSDAERIRQLHTLAAQYPRNVVVKLLLLDLLELAKRHAAAERICRSVVGNPYASARLRTAAGEYWARQGKQTLAKRVFSEIVEFRPTDPLARRRLGDLYRAFGWFHEAYRQYQTLAMLAPHDVSVQLLLALAAAGTGRINEALRLEQRVAASATGSGGAARWALLWASVQLARQRDRARKKGDRTLLASLASLTRRTGVLRHARKLRVVLTWHHPDAAVELWGAHPGSRLHRAGTLGPQFGIEAFGVRRPSDTGVYSLEVRRIPRMRNRRLRAELIVLWDEGGPNEKIQSFPLLFAPGVKVLRFTVKGRAASVRVK
jgi:vault protein inter-alpha-trypsin-like protein